MRKIVLPTDFSKNAWNAILYALEFFKKEYCTFYLVNVYTPVLYRMDNLPGPSMQGADWNLDRSLDGLEKTLARIKEEYFNYRHNFELLSAFNTLPDELKDIGRKHKVDLIVMGTQGATGAKELFLGTNTMHVIGKAEVPVLVIPKDYGFREIKHVLLATGYRSKHSKRELAPLMDLIERFGVDLHVLHALEHEQLLEEEIKNREHLKKLLVEIPHVSFVQSNGINVPSLIYDYVEENHIGLVVMMNTKHSFLERLLVKQKIDVVGYHSKVPFLVIPEPAQLYTKRS